MSGGSCPEGNYSGVIVWGAKVQGGIVLRGSCPGGSCPVGNCSGVIVWGVKVRVGNCPGVKFMGGNCPGGSCPGGNCH